MKNKIIWFTIFSLLIVCVIVASIFINKNGIETPKQSGESNILNKNKPCKMLSPTVDEIASENDDVKVVKVNVDESQNTAIKYQVMSIPTLVVIKNGNEVNRSVGVVDKEDILNMIK